jgi:plasmid maintenance system antidote protein VapI
VETPASCSDFREILKRELIRRINTNPSYSLRSFARSLEVSHSSLCQIMNRKRPLSQKMIQKMAAKLGFNDKEIDHFLEESDLNDSKLKEYEVLAYDTYMVASEWYHFAILQLIQVQGFRSDLSWISKRFDLAETCVEDAVERLKRLGLLNVREDGQFEDVSSGFTSTFSKANTNDAKRNLQRIFLQKATDALELVSFDRRSHSGMTMAIDSRRLPQAREKIQKFGRELRALLLSEKVPDSVYQLNVQLFPLTDVIKER